MPDRSIFYFCDRFSPPMTLYRVGTFGPHPMESISTRHHDLTRSRPFGGGFAIVRPYLTRTSFLVKIPLGVLISAW